MREDQRANAGRIGLEPLDCHHVHARSGYLADARSRVTRCERDEREQP
jgi:hypothetical protein